MPELPNTFKADLLKDLKEKGSDGLNNPKRGCACPLDNLVSCGRKDSLQDCWVHFPEKISQPRKPISLKLQRHMQIGPVISEPLYMGQEVLVDHPGGDYAIIISPEVKLRHSSGIFPGMVRALAHDAIGRVHVNVAMNLLKPWRED